MSAVPGPLAPRDEALSAGSGARVLTGAAVAGAPGCWDRVLRRRAPLDAPCGAGEFL